MDAILVPLAQVVLIALDLVVWVLIIGIAIHWLVAFNILNPHQAFVFAINNFCHRVTEPMLRPIRKFIPSFAGVDLSPLVLILGITFIQLLIKHNLLS